MIKKLEKRIPIFLLCVFMLATLFPVDLKSKNETIQVAQIGTHTYPTLKDAIDAVPQYEETTIYLLNNCSLPTMVFPADKNIIIDGTSNKYVIEAKDANLNFKGSVTFKDCDLRVSGIPDNHFMFIQVSSNAKLNFINSNCVINGDNPSKKITAMYFTSGGTLKAYVNMENSKMHITNCTGNGISWDGQPSNGYDSWKINQSELIIDNCLNGFIGTFDINILESNVQISNNTGYGSNGSNYYIENSNVEFNNNLSHGLSATNLTINNSVVNAQNNGYYGITYTIAMSVDSKSVVNVIGNATSNTCGGLRAGSKSTSTVESGAQLTIEGNHRNGLENYGNFTFEEDAILNITNNHESNNGGGIYNEGQLKLPRKTVIQNNSADKSGGGICNAGNGSMIVPDSVKLYNNYAEDSGDDICNQGNAKITFGQVGSDWQLAGAHNCTHFIDGWYDDSENNRWEAHNKPYHTDLFNEFDDTGYATIQGSYQLKAAHGHSEITIRPADITIYTGGNGYEGVVGDENVSNLDNNGFPEPGFVVELPDYLKDIDVTDHDKFFLTYESDDAKYVWYFEKYGEGEHNIYRIVPAADINSLEVRMQFVKWNDINGNGMIDDGEETIANSDDFIISEYLDQQLIMKVYGEGIDEGKVKLIEVKDDHVQWSYDILTEDATLTIRGTQIEDSNELYGKVVSDETEVSDGKSGIVAPEGTIYTINGGLVQINDKSGVSLLFDDIIELENSNANKDLLKAKADETLENLRDKGVQLNLSGKTEQHYMYKYLDLVDRKNGNVWLAANNKLKIYWPLPEGASSNDQFELLHFPGLHREMGVSTIKDNIDNCNVERIKIEKVTKTHIVFEVEPYKNENGMVTGGFSPFVLIWEKKDDSSFEPETPVVDESTEDTEGPVVEENEDGMEISESSDAESIKNPDTGGSNNIILFVCLISMASLGLGVSLKKRYMIKNK